MMLKKGLIWIMIASLFMAVVSLPDTIKSKFPNDPVSNWAKDQNIILGLDLQGGTQLDYRIDLRNAHAQNADDDSTNDVKITDIIEGVRNTIERRVNGLGVAEPQIYTSSIGDEEHIIVELAGIKDVNEAKAIVGKTIQLEFKEPKTELDPGEGDKIRIEAQEILEKAKRTDADFEALGKKVKTSDGRIDFRQKTLFKSDLANHYDTVMPQLQEGQVYNKLIESTETTLNRENQIVDQTGLLILKLNTKEIAEKKSMERAEFIDVAREISLNEVVELKGQLQSDFEDPKEIEAIWNTAEGGVTDIIEVGEQLRVYKTVTVEGNEDPEIKASHILIAYKGSERAGEHVLRSKREAKKEAELLLEEVKKEGADFAELARIHSDGPSADSGGDLGFFGRGMMAPEFEKAAYSLANDEISEVVETGFGFHIIKLTDRKEANIPVANVERIIVSKDDRAKLETGLKKASTGLEVTVEEERYQFDEILFNTTPDPWKSTGLDGAHFKFATVSYDQIGAPQVNIEFDGEGAELFENLTERLVGQRLAIFVGGELISAPNVNEKISGGTAVITGSYSLPEALKLATDLNTGAIDAPIILSGQHTISATLGENALKISLYAGVLGLIALAIFMILYYRLLGVFAVFALLIYAVIIIFILKTTSIVMTLAGIAGIILSIGMAVDANILIFERTKEELNSGKNFSASVQTGFERAWSSIRDSNMSSLITCAILWFFGNSIIRGFALMLAIGILISMFTAITVTRSFLRTLTGTALSKNRWLLGVKKMALKE